MLLRSKNPDGNTHNIIGLMSGTSCDGVDLAWCEISGSASTLSAELKSFQTVEYSAAMRERLLRTSEGSAADIALLNFHLGEFFAEAVLTFVAHCGQSPKYCDAIASHGHTVAHLPQQGATLQIGESAIIANATGITTISDFRVADVAAGGQGAPLVPYADWCLLRDANTHRIVQNIGGIANCSVLPADCTLNDVRAWDTGPGNMIIDECLRILTKNQKHFDENGDMAARGYIDEEWLCNLMRHEYFFRAPPATCGREEFGQFYARQFLNEGARRGLSTADVLATATAFTAESIAHSYRMHAAPLFVSDHLVIILGGGGAKNATLRRMIAQRLAGHRVLTHEDVGFNSDAKEAMAFAILAHETLNGVPSNVPSATGARSSAILGKIVPARLARKVAK